MTMSDDFEITPAMRRYLRAFTEWLYDRDNEDKLANRQVALADMCSDSWAHMKARMAARRQRRQRGALSKRQAQVLTLRCHGLSAPAIAAVLELSPYTVSNHFDSIRVRLGTGNHFLMARAAMRMGLVR